MNKREMSLVMTVLVLLLAEMAFAGEAPLPTLGHRVYTSRAEQYSLAVDPSDDYGRYGGTYRFTKNGKELWSAKLPFTFWDCIVTESGVVAGYAYTLGPRGFGAGGIAQGRGDFVVSLIDQEGRIRLKDVTKRHEGGMHMPPCPIAAGIILDESNDRLVVRVRNRPLREAWWSYRISTGAVIGKIEPVKMMKVRGPALRLVGARLVSQTPLILVHWLRDDGRLGAIFTLVDAQAKPVWQLELPIDYEGLLNERSEGILHDMIHGPGAILRTDAPAQFDVFFATESKRVTFSVKSRLLGHWSVTEVARRPYSWRSPN